MAAAASTEVPVPPQYKAQPQYDFRAAGEGPRGFKVGVTKYGRAGTKRKLDEYEAQVEQEQQQMQEDAANPAAAEAADADAVAAPAAKRLRRNTLGVGAVSGRPWKQPGQRAGSLRNPHLTSSWEKKMRLKAEAAAHRQQKEEARQVIKERRSEVRQKKQAAIKRKEEARKRAAVVTPVTTATAKRMMKSKKNRKLLQTADVGA